MEQNQKYKKLASSATMDGQEFEVGMIGLAYLRMMNKRREFFIASNVDKTFGKFDDLVVVHRASDESWQVHAIQLKYRKNAAISEENLLSLKGSDFGLVRYCDELLKEQEPEDLKLFLGTETVDFKFKYIIFTNAESKPVGSLDQEKCFFDTGKYNGKQFISGQRYIFDKHTNVFKKIYELADSKKCASWLAGILKCDNFWLSVRLKQKCESWLKEWEKVRDRKSYDDFLPKVQVYTDQASLEDLDVLIGRELQTLCNFSHGTVPAKLVSEYKEKIAKWWRNDNPSVLSDKSNIVGEVVADCLARSKEIELYSYGIDFTDDELKYLLMEIPVNGGVFIVKAQASTTVQSIKLMKALDSASNFLSHVELAAKKKPAFQSDKALANERSEKKAARDQEEEDLSGINCMFTKTDEEDTDEVSNEADTELIKTFGELSEEVARKLEEGVNTAFDDFVLKLINTIEKEADKAAINVIRNVNNAFDEVVFKLIKYAKTQFDEAVLELKRDIKKMSDEADTALINNFGAASAETVINVLRNAINALHEAVFKLVKGTKKKFVEAVLDLKIDVKKMPEEADRMTKNCVNTALNWDNGMLKITAKKVIDEYKLKLIKCDQKICGASTTMVNNVNKSPHKGEGKSMKIDNNASVEDERKSVKIDNEASVKDGSNLTPNVNPLSDKDGKLDERVDTLEDEEEDEDAAALAGVCARFRARDSFLFVDLATMHKSKKELLWTWGNTRCHTLVIECDSVLDQEDAKSLCRELADVFGNQRNDGCKKLLILIISGDNTFLNSHESFKNSKTYEDNFRYKHLSDNSRLVTLPSREINLQGNSTKLSGFADSCNEFFEKMDSEVLSQLLNQETRCGKDLDMTTESFIQRQLKTMDGEEVNAISLLSDEAAGKVVLVVAEPGMGKSTLFTHLAKQAKEDNHSTWVVHIKLNEWTHLFEEDNNAREFLLKCASTSTNALEKTLLESLTKELYIFVDGVDEVYPRYLDKVVILLSNIKKMGVRRLWVASRTVCQEELQSALGVLAHSLEPLTSDEQKELYLARSQAQGTERKMVIASVDAFDTDLRDALREDLSVLGSPLMAAKIYEIAFKTRKEAWVPRSWYEKYIEEMFNSYYNDKMKTVHALLPVNVDVRRKLWYDFLKIHGFTAARETQSLDGLRGVDHLEELVLAFHRRVEGGQDMTGIQRTCHFNGSRFFYPVLKEHFVHLLNRHQEIEAVN